MNRGNKAHSHYLKAPEIDAKDIRQLPNRKDLSRLYELPITHTNTEIKPLPSIGIAIKKFALIVGTIIPLPFIVAMYLIDLVTTTITTSSVLYFLPIIVIGLLVWIIVIATLYTKIDARFYHYGRGLIPFLLGYTFCLSLTIPLLYEIAESHTIFFAAELLLNSIILSISFIALPDSRFKKIIVSSITLLSIVALGVYLVVFHS